MSQVYVGNGSGGGGGSGIQEIDLDDGVALTASVINLNGPGGGSTILFNGLDNADGQLQILDVNHTFDLLGNGGAPGDHNLILGATGSGNKEFERCYIGGIRNVSNVGAEFLLCQESISDQIGTCVLTSDDSTIQFGSIAGPANIDMSVQSVSFKGQFTFSAGTFPQIPLVEILDTSIVVYCITSLGTVTAPQAILTTITAGVGFVPTSASALDTSIVNWAVLI